MKVKSKCSLPIRSLRHLNKLYLKGNYITRTGARVLATILPSLQKLKKLGLKGIHTDDESQQQLFTAVGSLRYLKKLVLSNTTISRTGVATLVAVLPTLHRLTRIFLLQVEDDDDGTFKRELVEAAVSLGVRVDD